MNGWACSVLKTERRSAVRPKSGLRSGPISVLTGEELTDRHINTSGPITVTPVLENGERPTLKVFLTACAPHWRQ